MPLSNNVWQWILHGCVTTEETETKNDSTKVEQKTTKINGNNIQLKAAEYVNNIFAHKTVMSLWHI